MPRAEAIRPMTPLRVGCRAVVRRSIWQCCVPDLEPGPKPALCRRPDSQARALRRAGRSSRSGTTQKPSKRSLDRLRWGLVPYWASEEKTPVKQSMHALRRLTPLIRAPGIRRRLCGFYLQSYPRTNPPKDPLLSKIPVDGVTCRFVTNCMLRVAGGAKAVRSGRNFRFRRPPTPMVVAGQVMCSHFNGERCTSNASGIICPWLWSACLMLLDDRRHPF